jgi:hypothetical protein
MLVLLQITGASTAALQGPVAITAGSLSLGSGLVATGGLRVEAGRVQQKGLLAATVTTTTDTPLDLVASGSSIAVKVTNSGTPNLLRLMEGTNTVFTVRA